MAWLVILSSEFREETHFWLPGLRSTFQREQPDRSPSGLPSLVRNSFHPRQWRIQGMRDGPVRAFRAPLINFLALVSEWWSGIKETVQTEWPGRQDPQV